MGQPVIDVSFKTTADLTMRTSGSGILGLILADDTKEDTSYNYKKYTDIVKSHWTVSNLDYLEKGFIGHPKQIIVERVTTTEPNYENAIKRLKQKKVNFIAIPDLTDESKTELIKTIKALRQDKCTIKFVLGNTAADDEGVVNFSSDDIKVGTKIYTTQQYTVRISGLLAGLALDKSATYQVLPEVEGFTESLDPDGDADAGKLILLNDGEKIKLGRAVTSLKTVSENKSEEMKKIKIGTAMDMMRDDISRSFESDYIGMNNSYDNKIVFMSAIKEYFKKLVRLGVLDDTYSHSVELNVSAIRDFLGDSVSEMADDEVKRQNTGSHIFLTAKIRFADAIEDLHFDIYM